MNASTLENIKKSTICLGFGEVCGYYRSLQQGLQQLGVSSVHIKVTNHVFDYGSSDVRNRMDRFLCQWNSWKIQRSNFAVVRSFFSGVAFFLTLLLAIHSAFCYDAFILCTYHRGWKVLAYLAKVLKKPVIVVLHGSDIRPPFMSGLYLDLLGRPNELVELTETCLKNAKFIERISDYVVSHPPCSQFLTKPFINGLQIGIPFQSPIPSGKGLENDMHKIVHAPSRPTLKGSDFFRSAVKECRHLGYPVNYVELLNEPNDVILNELASSDIALDELYSDSPLATFATESAYFGCLPIVGGYVEEKDLFLEKDLVPPTPFFKPESINEGIRSLVSDPILRSEITKRCQIYVRSRWSPKAVATRYVAILNGEIPAHWYVRPEENSYSYGWGMCKENSIKLAAAFFSNAPSQLVNKISNNYVIRFCQQSVKSQTAQS